MMTETLFKHDLEPVRVKQVPKRCILLVLFSDRQSPWQRDTKKALRDEVTGTKTMAVSCEESFPIRRYYLILFVLFLSLLVETVFCFVFGVITDFLLMPG